MPIGPISPWSPLSPLSPFSPGIPIKSGIIAESSVPSGAGALTFAKGLNVVGTAIGATATTASGVAGLTLLSEELTSKSLGSIDPDIESSWSTVFGFKSSLSEVLGSESLWSGLLGFKSLFSRGFGLKPVCFGALGSNPSFSGALGSNPLFSGALGSKPFSATVIGSTMLEGSNPLFSTSGSRPLPSSGNRSSGCKDRLLR